MTTNCENYLRRLTDAQFERQVNRLLARVWSVCAGGTQFGVDLRTLRICSPGLCAAYLLYRQEQRRRAVARRAAATALRLVDSREQPIELGAILRRATDNPEVHGRYCYYRVVLRRGVPAISYLMSDAGYVLPPDYTCCALSDLYDPKRLWWAPADQTVSPMDEDVFVIAETELPYPLITEAEWSDRAREQRQARRAATTIRPENNTDG